MNEEVAARFDRIEKKLDLLIAQQKSTVVNNSASNAKTTGDVAPDLDLDSARGNPEVRFSPKRWTGEDCKGRRYSQCPAAFLDELAEALDWFAKRDDESGAVDKNGNPKSKWGRLDASRARGWASRLRAQGNAASNVVRGAFGANAGPGNDEDDIIPF